MLCCALRSKSTESRSLVIHVTKISYSRNCQTTNRLTVYLTLLINLALVNVQISVSFFKFENMSSSHPQTSLCCTSNLWFYNVVTFLLKEWICLFCRLFALVRLLCIPQAPSSLPLTITSFYSFFLLILIVLFP